MKLSEIYLKFEKWEVENGVFELEIDGVYYWYLVRNRVYQNIMEELNILEKPDYTVPKTLGTKITTGLIYIKNALVNTTKRFEKKDVLVFNHSRKVLRGEEYVDIYTEWLLDELKEKNEKYLVMDPPLNWKSHLIKMDANTRGTEDLSFIKKVFFKYFSKPKDSEEIQRIQASLLKEFGSDGNITTEIHSQVNFFLIDYKKYNKMILKTNPKKIYYVVKNNYAPLIQAARDNKVEVTEIQHGIMGRYNLVYNYPPNLGVRYFPDKMVLFGEYWYNTTQLPIKKSDVSFFETEIVKERKKYSLKKKENSILFLSQPYVGNKMVGELKKLLSLSDFDSNIIYKLHPSEFKVWKTIYPDLQQLSKDHRNLEVVDSFEKPLNYYLSESKYAVGVNSTSLYEASYYNCELVILDIAGYELVTDNLSSEQYVLIKNTSDWLSLKERNKDTIIENLFYEKEC